ncbi:MAG TPA: molybdopterin-synthase adenylyltransferase MoeB [Marinobacterium sp.]|nr:molybdopterin-synthase adenylyltransferase MoeB [Marinobacterium sp.]
MNDQQLLQYSRHLLLPEIDMQGQQSWLDARVLVLGLGGLGSPVALYLASAGVGTLVLVDDDDVELSNLQRQVIHTTETLGQSKAQSASLQISKINPSTTTEVHVERLEGDALQSLVESVDLVVDCTDNFTTRHALNRACFAAKKPLISGAAIRFEGQITVYDPREESSPCYRCLYPETAELDLNCSTSGVFAPLVGMVGTVQAAEALKVLASIGEPLIGRLLVVDALRMDWRTLKLKADPNCPVCSGDHE